MVRTFISVKGRKPPEDQRRKARGSGRMLSQGVFLSGSPSSRACSITWLHAKMLLLCFCARVLPGLSLALHQEPDLILSRGEGVPKLTFVFLFSVDHLIKSQIVCRWSIRMSYLQNNLFKSYIVLSIWILKTSC